MLQTATMKDVCRKNRIVSQLFNRTTNDLLSVNNFNAEFGIDGLVSMAGTGWRTRAKAAA
jgi:hypothetical protein